MIFRFNLGYTLVLPGFEGYPINNAQLVINTSYVNYNVTQQTLFPTSILPGIYIGDSKSSIYWYQLTSGYMKFMQSNIQITGRVAYVLILPLFDRFVNTTISYGNSSYGAIVGTLDTYFGSNPSGGDNMEVNNILQNQCCPEMRKRYL